MIRRALLLAALALCAAARAEPLTLGRLFTSPAERAQRDARRDSGAGAAPVAMPQSAPAPAPAPAPPAEPLEWNGMLQPSRGKATIWLNQVPRAIEHAGPTAPLRPGQRDGPADGRVNHAHPP